MADDRSPDRPTGRRATHRLSTAARRVRRCEELAGRGTGHGTCDTPLDQHGQCPRADQHADSHPGPR